jgi:ribosome maturation factor RimP
MSQGAKMVLQQIESLAEPLLEQFGFELVDLEFLSERGRWVLRIYIDKEGGITLDDCARVSGELGNLIDVKDVVPHEYVLEVSSPGLDRPLKREKDFIRAIGRKVKLRTVPSLEGRRNFTGNLTGFKEGILCLEVENQLVYLPLKNVEKANLVYEFEK